MSYDAILETEGLFLSSDPATRLQFVDRAAGSARARSRITSNLEVMCGLGLCAAGVPEIVDRK